MKASLLAHILPAVVVSSLTISSQPAQAQIHSRLWGLSQVGADKAWELGYTGHGVIIGVMDQSADPLHTEYQARWLGGMNIDGTPYVLDPTHTHGTHVTGTIAGRRVGVAPGASIYNVNWSLPGVTTDTVANGYYWSADRGARAINNSWGLTRFDAALGRNRSIAINEVDPLFIHTDLPNLLVAFQSLAQQDIVQIFATSNDRRLDYGNGDIRYTLQPGVLAALPAFFPELTSQWIAVTAVGPTGEYGYYAQPCGVAKNWCMAAPGGSGITRVEDQIFSAEPGNTYGYLNGTSMATPHVTGAFAIAAEMFPRAAGSEITQLLLQTAKDIGAPGIDDDYGWGLLSVGNIAASISSTTASTFAKSNWARSNAFSAVRRSLNINTRPSTLLRTTEDGRFLHGYASAPEATPYPFDEALSQAAKPMIWAAPINAHATAIENTSSSVGGFLAGIDLTTNPAANLGLALGYTHTSLAAGTDSASSHALHLGAYGHWDQANWFANGTAQASVFQQDIRRRDIAGATGVSSSPVGQTNILGAGLGASFEVGHLFTLNDDLTIAPYVGIASQLLATNAAQEAGAGIFSLSVDNSSHAEVEVGPGVRVQSRVIDFEDGSTLQFTGDVGYLRTVGTAYKASTSLLGRDIVTTMDPSRDAITLGGQLSVTTPHGSTWFASYDGALQHGASSHVFSAGAKARF